MTARIMLLAALASIAAWNCAGAVEEPPAPRIAARAVAVSLVKRLLAFATPAEVCVAPLDASGKPQAARCYALADVDDLAWSPDAAHLSALKRGDGKDHELWLIDQRQQTLARRWPGTHGEDGPRPTLIAQYWLGADDLVLARHCGSACASFLRLSATAGERRGECIHALEGPLRLARRQPSIVGMGHAGALISVSLPAVVAERGLACEQLAPGCLEARSWLRFESETASELLVSAQPCSDGASLRIGAPLLGLQAPAHPREIQRAAAPAATSPDDKYLAYVHTADHEAQHLSVRPYAGTGLPSLDVELGELSIGAEGSFDGFDMERLSPSWSPDSKALVLKAYTGGRGLRLGLLRLASRSIVPLLPAEQGIEDVLWTGAGQLLVLRRGELVFHDIED